MPTPRFRSVARHRFLVGLFYSSSCDLSGKIGKIVNMSHATRSLSRTFVLLDKRLNAVPSKADLGRMVTTGKVRDISFSKSQDADAIGTNLTAAFPSLAGKDLARYVQFFTVF